MGVARFTMGTADLERICDDIRANAVISDSEKRRRLLDIEIAISEAIQGLLAAGAPDRPAIGNEIQNKVIGQYDTWKGQGGDSGTPPVSWPFQR